MAENVAVDDDKQAAISLDAGFKQETPSDVPETKPVAEVAPEPKPAAAPKPTPVAKPPVQADPAPKYVQLTEENFNRFMAAADKTASMDGQLSKVFGTVGNLKQVIEKLQSDTPAGAAIEISDDDFAELAEDYPELAASNRKGLERVLKKLRGTGPANATAAAPDPEAMKKLVSDAQVRREEEALEDVHPKWREIVGATHPVGGSPAQTEYRQWLAKQPAEYQSKLNSTNNAAVISRSIDRFLAAKPATTPQPNPAAKTAARTDRIRAAIQPRGDGGQPGPSKTAVDEFHAGFSTG